MPPELKGVMRRHMKPDYVEVECIQDGDAATHTNDRVDQTHAVLPSAEIDAVSAVVETVRYAVETHVDADAAASSASRFAVPPKIVLFFPTARMVHDGSANDDGLRKYHRHDVHGRPWPALPMQTP